MIDLYDEVRRNYSPKSGYIFLKYFVPLQFQVIRYLLRCLKLFLIQRMLRLDP